MRTFFLSAIVFTSMHTAAQNNTTANIIEGGKTLVELVRVFKTPKFAFVHLPPALVERKDSCAVKNTSDISI